MSHQTLDIVFDQTGQSLYFDAPEGRPASVTSSTVFESTTGDDGTEESATTGDAAVETSPNTTFSGASGDGKANPRVCFLTATTGCARGRRYEVANALGEKEWVEVTGISSGAHVVARQPLQNAYASADTFVTTRITHAVDSTWVADTNNLSDEYDPNPRYRWRLVYVVASVTYTHDVYFDLLRYAGRHDVTGLDVERRFAGWMRALPTFEREDQGAQVIAEAYQHAKFDMYNLALPDQSVRNREVMNELVKLAAGALVFNDDAHWKFYADRFAQLLAWGKTHVGTDSSGASAQADRRPLLRR